MFLFQLFFKSLNFLQFALHAHKKCLPRIPSHIKHVQRKFWPIRHFQQDALATLWSLLSVLVFPPKSLYLTTWFMSSLCLNQGFSVFFEKASIKQPVIISILNPRNLVPPLNDQVLQQRPQRRHSACFLLGKRAIWMSSTTLLRHSRQLYSLWQYRLWSFQGRDTKLERFGLNINCSKMKLPNLENWSSGKLPKSAKI